MIVEVCAVIIAGCVLVLTARQVSLQSKANQVQLFTDALRDVRTTHIEFTRSFVIPYENIKSTIQRGGPGMDLDAVNRSLDKLAEDQHLTGLQFFNVVESVAFLINHGYLKRRDLQDYFKPAFVEWYERYFKLHYSAEEKDEKLYEEFKQLYRVVKEC